MEIETVRSTSGRAATRAVGHYCPTGVTYGRHLLVPPVKPARGMPRLTTDERRVLAVLRTATADGSTLGPAHLARVCHLPPGETRRIIEKLHAMTLIEPVGPVAQPQYRIARQEEPAA